MASDEKKKKDACTDIAYYGSLTQYVTIVTENWDTYRWLGYYFNIVCFVLIEQDFTHQIDKGNCITSVAFGRRYWIIITLHSIRK